MAVGGQELLVVPQLVTGCKIWHLRPEGSFYPKSAWLAATGALPPGAQARCWLCPSVCDALELQARLLSTAEFLHRCLPGCAIPEAASDSSSDLQLRAEPG